MWSVCETTARARGPLSKVTTMVLGGPLTILLLGTMSSLPLPCPATGQLTGSRWTGQTGQGVSTSQLTVPSRSKLDCIKECGRYPYCHTAAFQRSTATCHLLPVITDVTPGHDVIVYQDNDPLCSEADAPSLGQANATVTWTRTLTSLTGYVTCDDHSVWTGDALSCGVNNTWTVGGQCVEKYWTQPEIYQFYYLPFTADVGWTLCVTGTPFSNASRFSLNFYNGDRERPLKAKFQFFEDGTPKYNSRFVSHLAGDNDTDTQQVVDYPALPMTESSPFYLVVQATSKDSLTFYVDGIFYYTYQLTVFVSTIVSVRFFGDVTLHDLDVWCDTIMTA